MSNNSRFHKDLYGQHPKFLSSQMSDISMGVSSHHSSGHHFYHEKKTMTWNVNDLTLKPMPRFYPLGITHVVIDDDEETPSLICRRIVECLKKCSIASIFNNGKAIAWCETTDHVRLIIRLFAKTKEPNLEKNTTTEPFSIIVEVQRIDGCAVIFHNYCRVILQAAKGEKSEIRPEIPHYQRLPSSCSDISSNTEAALEIVNDLLKKDRIDARILGMESLRMQTDPEGMTDLSSSIHCAHEVLLAKGEARLYPSIRDAVWRLLVPRKLEDEDDDLDDYLGQRNYDLLHNHSLAIVANSLTILVNEGKLENPDDSPWLYDLVDILVHEVENSIHGNRPHDAYLAAKALNILIRVSKTAKHKAVESGAGFVVEKSHRIGMNCHDLLAHESERVMEALKAF